MVIGPDPEAQLEPFSENIEMPKYKLDSVPAEDIERFMAYYLKEGKISAETTFDDAYAERGDDWNGNRWEKDENGEWAEYSTYNPNSKWDWYVLGGRWSGFLKIKQSELASAVVGETGFMCPPAKVGWADQATKGSIDFLSMVSETRDTALANYDQIKDLLGGEIPKLDFTWKEILADTSIDGINAKRAKYHEQPAVVAQNNVKSDIYFDIEDFQCTREEYGQRAADSALCTFAVLRDGVWNEKGRMGWFGMAHDLVDEHQWQREVVKMLEGLPDDTLISIYDCHI